MKNATLVEVTSELANKLVIDRHSDGGFQRSLNTSRVNRMTNNIGSNGHIIPPVIVAKSIKGLILVDGQHRIEAYKKSPYKLYPYIVDGTKEKDIVESFVDINRTGVRVSLDHVLHIDPSDYGKRIRALADKYGATVRQAHYAVVGALGR